MRVASYINHAGRSYNARLAEEAGKLPLTRATPVLARRLGMTQKKARELLLREGPCEWHYTGLYAMYTDYYDVEGIVAQERGAT